VSRRRLSIRADIGFLHGLPLTAYGL
jgi:hypothetical protein